MNMIVICWALWLIVLGGKELSDSAVRQGDVPKQGRSASSQELMTAIEMDEISRRLTADATRVLFFARRAASEYGGSAISDEHLLIGILDAVPQRVAPLLGDNWSLGRVKKEATLLLGGRPRLDVSVELPFEATVGRTLRQAAQEADKLGTTAIRPEHMLMGLLDSANSSASALLRKAGVSSEAIGLRLRSG